MKKLYGVVFFLFAFNSVFAQLGGEDEVYLDGNKIEAQFQGEGLNAFGRFVHSKLDMTKIEKEGQLICSFTVNEEGALKNIRIVKDLGGESALEMIRVLQLSPKWQPATRNGKPFSTTYKIPFTFQRKKQENKQLQVVEDNPLGKDEKVYVAVEKPAVYPNGGYTGFKKYFESNFVNPIKDGKNDLKVVIQFVINNDGSLSDVEVQKLPAKYLDLKDEIVRVITSSPKWVPGMQNGRKIRMKYTISSTLKI